MSDWISEFKIKWGFMPILGGAPEPVSLELDTKLEPEPKVEVKVEPKKEETQYVKVDDLKKLSKQLDGISSAYRTSEKEKKELAKKLEDLESRLSGRQIKSSEAQDELDKLLEQGDWRTPVGRVAEETVTRILKQREAEQNQFHQQNEKSGILESSKKQVRERYPDIDDPNSDTAKAYIKILNDKPHYLKSEYGPILAMRDMEDILDEQDMTNNDAESKRRQRVNATSVRPGTPAKSTTITLTKEQKEFCKNSGLSEESYLKTLKGMSGHSKEIE